MMTAIYTRYKVMLSVILLLKTYGKDIHERIDDPCVTAEILPDSEYRGDLCPEKINKQICDRYLQDIWYRTGDNSTIITSPVALGKCATQFPIWMNGTLPTVLDGEVTRIGCLSHVTTCSFELDIKVKNCGSHFVYKLEKPSSCDAAYCFGEGKGCPPLDPCHRYYHNEMKFVDGSRMSNCPTKHPSCDNSVVEDWYVLGGRRSPGTVPTTCPARNYCGTENPIWINNTVPLVEGQIVNVAACVHDGLSCCGKEYNIKMVKCSQYVSYYLKPPTTCDEQYCVDGPYTCPNEPLTSTSTTKQTNILTSSTQSSGERDERNGAKISDPGPIIGIVLSVILVAIGGTAVIIRVTKYKHNKRVSSEVILTIPND